MCTSCSVDSYGGAENPVESLVFECGVDLCVAASIKLPHLEGDLATFGVALGRLIPLVQLADFVINCNGGIGAGRHLSIEHSPCASLSIATGARLEVDDYSICVDRSFVGCKAV